MTDSSMPLARAMVAAWVAAGCRHAVLCPGSRSAPLAYALAEAEEAGWLELDVRLDERGAGFFALGLARAHCPPRPVLVVTTSGTAVANLHPALLEASHAGLPLVALTADRPHELRGTGANQTTWQVGIFAGAVRAAADFPVSFAPQAVRGQVARLAAAAGGLAPGPVHLNVAFAEPLTWDGAGPGSRPEPIELPALTQPAVTLEAGRRTVLVAGDGAGEEAAQLARAGSWPLLAEPTSGARSAEAIAGYRELLATALAAEIERVVVMGHPTLSRPVSRLLARRDVEIVACGHPWTDAAGTAARYGAFLPSPPTAVERDFAARWHHADLALARELPELTGAEKVARAVLAASSVVVLGSSNAIRAADSAPGAFPHALANRGLAGIDGTLATALGVGRGLGAPVRALVGDLTFLHDASALLRGQHEREVDLDVVVLADSGGAIFSTLEYGAPGPHARYFERLFATPQRAGIAQLAAGYGAAHRFVDAASETFERDLGGALAAPPRGRSVLEVCLGRGNLREIAALRAAAARRAVAGL